LGTVVDVTVDHAGESWLGPVVLAVIEFAGGRQITLEVADVEAADDVRVGDQVAMTFRRQRASEGVNDYFWKARPGAAVWRG
jgi:hydroxymethylglutaryl-CoA synthase